MQNQRQEITQQEGDTTSDESAISMIKRIFAVAHLLVKADIQVQIFSRKIQCSLICSSLSLSY
jgi:hypothetical protein